MLRKVGIAAGSLFVLATAAALAQQESGAPKIEGSYHLKGKMETRGTEADVTIERAGAGFRVRRTGKLTGFRFFRRNRPFTWTGEGTLSGRVLTVTFRLPIGAPTAGLANGVGGGAGPGAEADANVVTGTYTLSQDDRELVEALTNTTKKKPEEWWTKIETKGKRDDTNARTRVKLGGSVKVDRESYDVVVPTDGTLTLTTQRGVITAVKAFDGTAVVTTRAATVKVDVKKNAPLGSYTVELADANGGTLAAQFVQDGRIDPRIRPWSSHTHYPLYEFDDYEGTSPNADALFAKNGPLEKLDRALGLAGNESAVQWEKGGDYRTDFEFAHGHYTRVSSPRETHAELDWKADLNGDGVIGGLAVDRFTAMDANKDGKATRDEAVAFFEGRAIESAFLSYDENRDGKITTGEVGPEFLRKYGTNGVIDRAAFAAALRRDFKKVIDDVAAAETDELMAGASDGHDFVVLADLKNPGASDFVDKADVDGDLRTDFDQDNIAVVESSSGKKHIGNKLEEKDGKVKLWKGLKRDELVVELKKENVKRVERGVADGKLDATYSMGWWGHCNAWSMASIVFRKPEGELTTNGVTLTVRDQKGLLVEFGMGATERSSFDWRPDQNGEISGKKYAAGFHRQLKTWLREEQKGLMADMDMKNPVHQKGFQVWNYPLLGYTCEMKEAPGDDPLVIECSNVIEKGSYSDADNSGTSKVTYTLHFDGAGGIREDDASKTDWTTKQKLDGQERGVFVRYLIHPLRFTARGTGNPNVTLERLQKLFGNKLKYNTLDDLPPN